MAAEGLFKLQVEDSQTAKRDAFTVHHLPTQQWLSIHKGVLLFICCLLVQAAHVESATVNCASPTAQSLLDGINKVLGSNEIRPVISLKTPTNVSVRFTLYGILGVDEKAQILTTFLWQSLEWKIEYLSWDIEQCGAWRISLPRTKVWSPDILINQFMDADRSPSAPYVYLSYDGDVFDDRPVRVVSSCNLDIYTFPFDVQNCTFTFNSYLHMAGDIQLSLGRSAEDTLRISKRALETVGEWELIDIKAEDPYDEISDDYWDKVIYHIVLRRRAMLYVVNLLVPSCFLLGVDLFSFLLPPQSVDRSAFKMTLILGYTVFLLIMNDLLPVTGNRIPLINVFFSICLALMVASLLETVLITNIMCNSSTYPALPRWVRVLFLKYLARLVCMSQKPSEQDTITLNPAFQENEKVKVCPSGTVGTDEAQTDKPVLGELKKLGQDLQAIRNQVDKHFAENQKAEEWIQLGNVIDRLLFGLYILFITSPGREHSKSPEMATPKVPCVTSKQRLTFCNGFFLICVLLIQVPPGQCLESAVTVNCSRPDPEVLFSALDTFLSKKNFRPVRNLSTPTEVSVGITVVSILGVDEKQQILTTFIWVVLEWDIEFLSWDPEQCGASRISLLREKLWTPDILISEFMDEDKSPNTPYVYLESNGRVFDDRPVRVVSSCNLDIYSFPFDLQNCSLTFGSYLHTAADIKMVMGVNVMEALEESRSVMEIKGEWELISITASNHTLKTIDYEYQEVIFYVVLRRRPTLYVVNLLVPSCFLITVDLFSFLLPPQSVDRSAFKMTLILGYTVFLLIMNDLLPVTGNKTPIINVFFSICLALMVASLLETVLITNILYSSSHYPEVPRWIRVLVLKYLARLVGLAKKPTNRVTITLSPPVQEKPDEASFTPVKTVSQPNTDPGCARDNCFDPILEEVRKLSRDLTAIRLKTDKRIQGSKNSEDWVQIGNIIDRLLFGLYIVFITVSFITIIIIWIRFFVL
ncbi:hypothetical protein AGOR_G00145030 [Albula goreensis]|uniref:Uncharacterized protein n=1 Tax=Albula goreensis TaxID=1534307 RepID=A0A8T3D9Q2_9TELE|nr:hypothetical protein AGOR_G00145030 [Albula goreensis]